jgi:hypothetical protein
VGTGVTPMPTIVPSCPRAGRRFRAKRRSAHRPHERLLPLPSARLSPGPSPLTSRVTGMTTRRCRYRKANGHPCGAPPLKGGDRCFWHTPGKADEVAEARRLGGLRRRKEQTVATAYAFEGVQSPEDMGRVLEIAILDTLSLENTVGRNRTLIAAVQAAAKLYETMELSERVRALEAAHEGGGVLARPVFDFELDATEVAELALLEGEPDGD